LLLEAGFSAPVPQPKQQHQPSFSLFFNSQLAFTMGKLIWHQYARYISITACLYTVWSAFFGLFYRKFFWDFVGGILRDPGGIQAPPASAVFITLIVNTPVVQIFAIVVGLMILAVEYPVPRLKQLPVYRSFAFRIVLLIFQTFLTILYYQGTNAALYSLIAAFCYSRAQLLGETMAEAKENRGKSEGA